MRRQLRRDRLLSCTQFLAITITALPDTFGTYPMSRDTKVLLMVPVPHNKEAIPLLVILLHPFKHKEDIVHLPLPSADKPASVMSAPARSNRVSLESCAMETKPESAML